VGSQQAEGDECCAGSIIYFELLQNRRYMQLDRVGRPEKLLSDFGVRLALREERPPVRACSNGHGPGQARQDHHPVLGIAVSYGPTRDGPLSFCIMFLDRRPDAINDYPRSSFLNCADAAKVSLQIAV
jgi:hypothetical protein